jgi:dienelactone hydrolase
MGRNHPRKSPETSIMPAALRTSQLGAILLAASALLASCANNPTPQSSVENRAANRSQALATAVGMPDASTHEVRDVLWMDDQRQRQVPARLYLPQDAAIKAPLVIFSHGIGGSREGYSYIGKYLAANGIAALHVQHAGSDRNLWGGNPIQMVGRLQEAAKDSEAIDRTKDMRFALTQVLTDAQLKQRLDANRIAAAGHSYGANTTLLLAGARVLRDGKALDLSDPRIKVAVIISAPPFYGEGDPRAILQNIRVPSLHITATGDEINIPGYFSPAKDRVAVYEAAGSAAGKLLAVFTGGSHSMFTDRLGTGGSELNPQVKKATRELMLAFLQKQWSGDAQALTKWSAQHAPLVARFEQKF